LARRRRRYSRVCSVKLRPVEPMTLRDDTVLLSIPTERDIPNIVRWCNDDAAKRWMPGLPQPYGRADAEFFLNQIVRKNWEAGGPELVWAIRLVSELNDDGEAPALGTIGLTVSGHAVKGIGEIGFVLGPWARGHGLVARAVRLVAGFAMSETGARLGSVHWEAMPGNIASWRVVRACGFRFDGVWPAGDTSHTPGNWYGSLRAGEPMRVRPEYSRVVAVGSGSAGAELTLAGPVDLDDVAELYRQQIGLPGNTWNEYYPTEETIRNDLAVGALYLLRSGAAGGDSSDAGGVLIGAVSLGPLDEIDDINWGLQNPLALSRLAVEPPFQGMGFGTRLARLAVDRARSLGHDGVVLLVSPRNTTALTIYKRLGFEKCGELFRWDQHWLDYRLAFAP
ncbi:MAG: GNAT family N-acetyltransferase, partial [Promicromonosporaceae bacterium]|nr:GNAT family N-acetyltransferase [Promicromonosporaceae bacterium]